jgi:hypothetical protein
VWVVVAALVLAALCLGAAVGMYLERGDALSSRNAAWVQANGLQQRAGALTSRLAAQRTNSLACKTAFAYEALVPEYLTPTTAQSRQFLHSLQSCFGSTVPYLRGFLVGVPDLEHR